MKRPAFKRSDIFRRLNAPYRVVFIDDESLEEVASYRLTMRQLYIVLSMGLVIALSVIVAILLITPLRYYIPGYGDDKARREIIYLKQSVDSLTDVVNAQHKYEENIRKVITGKVERKRDTTMLNVAQIKKEAAKNMLPMPEIKKDVSKTIRQENKKKEEKK
jgi:hypothetical protein